MRAPACVCSYGAWDRHATCEMTAPERTLANDSTHYSLESLGRWLGTSDSWHSRLPVTPYFHWFQEVVLFPWFLIPCNLLNIAESCLPLACLPADRIPPSPMVSPPLQVSWPASRERVELCKIAGRNAQVSRTNWQRHMTAGTGAFGTIFNHLSSSRSWNVPTSSVCFTPTTRRTCMPAARGPSSRSAPSWRSEVAGRYGRSALRCQDPSWL